MRLATSHAAQLLLRRSVVEIRRMIHRGVNEVGCRLLTAERGELHPWKSILCNDWEISYLAVERAKMNIVVLSLLRTFLFSLEVLRTSLSWIALQPMRLRISAA